MRNSSWRWLLLAGALAALPAWADSVSIDTQYGRVTLTDGERQVLREYYREAEAPASGKKLNKGMQKRAARGKSLPPGWQKKMNRGETVPADVWAAHEPVPVDVLRRLPPQPEGVVTVRIDTKIVRVVAATHVILDAFDLI